MYQNSLEMIVSECCLGDKGDTDGEKCGQAKRKQEITNNILIADTKKKNLEHYRYLLEHVYSMYRADGDAKLSQDMLVPCRSFKKVLMMNNKVLSRTHLYTGAINSFDANNGTDEHNTPCQLKLVLKWDVQVPKLLRLYSRHGSNKMNVFESDI